MPITGPTNAGGHRRTTRCRVVTFSASRRSADWRNLGKKKSLVDREDVKSSRSCSCAQSRLTQRSFKSPYRAGSPSIGDPCVDERRFDRPVSQMVFHEVDRFSGVE
jgi:hypothetical protein